MTKIVFKFGQQQMVMVNYAYGFNQSESGNPTVIILARIVTVTCTLYNGLNFFNSLFFNILVTEKR